MKKPLIQRRVTRKSERGVTLALVAASIVAMLGFAALSIDVASLYTASCEAQRAADAAALAGARWLSVSGLTGDPTNSANQWINACTQAKQIAMGTAIQNNVAGNKLTTAQVTLTVLDKGGNGCGASGTVDFGVNPQITVQVQVANIPLYFAPVLRAFYSPGASRSVMVTATAKAEAYNPSRAVNFSSSGLQVPVQPRCVKPWMVPNFDPTTGQPFLAADGSINNSGIRTFGGGVIGEQFSLGADCATSGGACSPIPRNPPRSVGNALDYIPADITGPFVAVPSTANGSQFQEASAGCDTGTFNPNTGNVCGTANGSQADLTMPNVGGVGGDTSVAVQALINQGSGEDTLDTAVYPFQIQAGAGSPLVANGVVATNQVVSASNNIVTVPIIDNTVALSGNRPAVTILGYLQLFVRSVNTTNGHIRVTVLNVAGCGTATGNALGGTSPVPVRLIQ